MTQSWILDFFERHCYGGGVSERDVIDVAVMPLTARGVHVIDPDAVAWSYPAPRAGRDPEATRNSGVQEKWFVKPTADDDRFPVSAIRFGPGYTFARHWHTEGEFMLILRGSATVGDQRVGTGSMAYNDARTIYGAEAAGPEGCDFLMIRRAWARNTVVMTDADVARAEAEGIVNSLDRVACSMADRGLHTFDPASIEPVVDTATGLTVRWLMPPDPLGDRPPIAVTHLSDTAQVTWNRPEQGLFLYVLRGAAVVNGTPITTGKMVYVDAGHSFSIGASSDEPAELLSVQPIAAPMHQAA
jgi:redox-sensitive bicupin YhaK (pirin superfamily)